jgi:hypothetical protein
MEKKTMYFGHPVNFYNTPKESELLRIIKEFFPDFEIENPNQPHHSENYQKWKIEKGKGMLYYFEKVLPRMDAGTFLSFEDGMFGAGVFGEAEWLYKKEKPIYEITVGGIITPLSSLDYSRCLSIEETIERIRGKK